MNRRDLLKGITFTAMAASIPLVTSGETCQPSKVTTNDKAGLIVTNLSTNKIEYEFPINDNNIVESIYFYGCSKIWQKY